MKTARKVLVLALCAILLVSATIMGTMAYLTSTDEVTNTFTVGKVKISLDEALVNDDGKPVDADGEVVEDLADAKRVDGNEYHLLPGHTYTKDPTVTVEAKSEEAYVRMLVTVTESSTLDGVFPNAVLTTLFGGYDGNVWTYIDDVEDTDADTRTYEFRYKTTVVKSDEATVLEPLFTSINVPGTLTNVQIAELADLEINVVAQAIQADGFTTADAAWAAFDAQNT